MAKITNQQDEVKFSAKIAELEVSKIQRYINVSGNLSYRGFIKIKPERRGQISYLNQNQFASTGEIILELNSSSEKANVVRYAGALNKAKYQLDRAKERSKDRGAVAEAEMQNYESEYQIALGDKKRSEAELQKMTIVAPFDGRIGIYNFSVGSFVTESDIICTYVSHKDMIVDFTLSELEALNVYPGKKIIISSNLFGDRLFLDGIVEKVDPSTGANYGIRVRARIKEESKSQLSAGSSVTVSISIDSDEPVPNVPEKALEERSGINYLNIATPNEDGSFTVYKTPVDVQSRVNGMAILSSAVKSRGDKLLYALPEPGTNLDGKKVLPKEGSNITLPVKNTESVKNEEAQQPEVAKEKVTDTKTDEKKDKDNAQSENRPAVKDQVVDSKEVK